MEFLVHIEIVWPPEMPSVKPWSRISIARVTMNAGSLSLATIRPLKSPTTAPSPNMIARARYGFISIPTPPFASGATSHAASIGARPTIDWSDTSM